MTVVVSTSESRVVSIIIFEDKHNHNLEEPVLSDALPEPVCMLTLCWIQRVFGDDLDCGFLERLRWIESEMTDDFVTTTGTGRITLRNTSRYILKLYVFFGIFHRNHARLFSYGL